MKFFIEDILLILGPKGWVDAQDSSSWKRDWLNQIGLTPLGIALPKTTLEVSKILKLCSTHEIKVIPQGGNTSLVGGSVLNRPGGIILSLNRMNNITTPDLVGRSIAVEAGVVLQKLHDSLENSNMAFPMRLGSQGSAQIGGLISSNAGGSHAFKYGMTQDLVLGMEVVLPDGEIWDGMRFVQKDNTGYQLRKLFCGAEGTLGVITQAVMKLVPVHNQEVTVLISITELSSLIKISSQLRNELDDFLTAIEFFSDTGLMLMKENIAGVKLPFQNQSPFYLLFEASSSNKEIPLESIVTSLVESIIDNERNTDAIIALSNKQKAELWKLREEQPEGQRLEGIQLKHDISVPPSKIEHFIKIATQNCHQILKDVRVNPFGHLGDGNIHFNLSPPLGKKDFSGLDHKFELMIAELADKLGGSFAAEHGIGSAKIHIAENLRGNIERNMMKRIKQSFDNSNMLNPGVVIRDDS